MIKLIYICDNTDMFRLVMVTSDGEIVWKDRNIPKWLSMTLINK